MKEFFFEKNKRGTPKNILPSRKTDLLQLDPGENVLVWFGHSSYFMQVDGKKILVDPVFSGSASPIGTTRSFKGSDVYMVDDLPVIDYLFISHDHYDHLDYTTINKLKPKIKKIICGLGTGAHFERWGFDSIVLLKRTGMRKYHLIPGFTAVYYRRQALLRAKFSTGINRYGLSFVLQTPGMKIFIGGDSGYDSHFA
jgi:L-ascorbate metabolism protein UlaG (beta-lactamase superfamily)